MKYVFTLGTEIVLRYLSAFAIGMLFAWVARRFLNHLGMIGDLIFTNLALISILSIPLWWGLAKRLARKYSLVSSELISAGIIGLLSPQPIYLTLYTQYAFLPSVDEFTKTNMLTWYVATLSSFSISILSAGLFLAVSNVIYRSRKADA